MRRLASSIFAPLTCDFLNRFSILVLLVQKALLPCGTRETNPTLLLQIPFRSFFEGNRHENEHLLYFLVVLLCARTSDDSQQSTDLVQQGQSRLGSSIVDSVLVITNLVLSNVCLGSLHPVAVWCIGSRFFARQAWLRTSFLAPLLVWFNYGLFVFLARILRQ